MEENKKEQPALSGTFHGHVVKVDKHRLNIMFKGEDGSVYGIGLKRKKLNDTQKQLLKVDLPVRIDFSTMKIFFMGADTKWY